MRACQIARTIVRIASRGEIHQSGAFMASNVAPVIPHQSTGTTKRIHPPLAFATFGALLSSDLPLTRRQHEMITTVVSVTNRCFY